ncbi:hypothetical protein [Reichenbachiella sp. 5M10]|uniref:hypothetical protein n=1 Tax=Reichenbachiella sp. 5M10 TaxID=1889772 RepID=UPI001179926B|nr:hypothetical protein [Reichenbachiella sp. 5M10]
MTILRKSANRLFLDRHYLSDFKSMMRTLTSGRVMLVSTRFRSDLFYSSPKANKTSILKLWALYTQTNLDQINRHDLMLYHGQQTSLTQYFQSINQLSTHWYHYQQYKKALAHTLANDPFNPLSQTVLACDQFLISHYPIQRLPLIESNAKPKTPPLTQDTFSLAMRIIRGDSHTN